MKQYLNKGSLILIMTICIAVACKKSADQPLLENNNNATSTTGNVPHAVDNTLSAPVTPVFAAGVRGLLCVPSK